MDILDKLIEAIMGVYIFKVRNKGRFKYSDVLDYAFALGDYIIDSGENVDREELFMSKFVIDYLVNDSFKYLEWETEEEKIEYLDRLRELRDKFKNINYAGKINSFDEFIESLYFPLVNKDKYASEVISRFDFYNNADDLYWMMSLAVAHPNDKLFKGYSKHYRAIKLEYIKMIARVVNREISKYNLELDEADKQFVNMCYLIEKYLKTKEASTYYDTASTYLAKSIGIFKGKIMQKSK